MTIQQITISSLAVNRQKVQITKLLFGYSIMIIRSIGRDTRAISKSIVHLTQKGIADDLSGLVDNASNLMAATSNLIQTTKGIGVFLIISGSLFMIFGIVLTLYIGLN